MVNAKFTWTPVKEEFGADVAIDLNEALSPSMAEGLVRLFNDRHLLLFRNQSIDYGTQRKTVSIFGNLLATAGDAKYVSTVHDVEGNPIEEEPRDIDPRSTMFHSDLAFTPSVPIRASACTQKTCPTARWMSRGRAL